MIDDRYTAQDLAGTLRAIGVRWRWLLTGLSSDAVAAVQPALRTTVMAVGAASTDLDDIAEAAMALPPDAQRAAVEATEAAMSEAGRAVVATGFVPSSSGRVVGVFASDGGVPKRPIDEAVVGRRGVEGDRQATRKHHGRVSQALCLWSAEVIDALAAEGHPIGPGCAGENVLVDGVDWTSLRPAVRIQMGTVLAEVSGWALPCKKNAQWFSDRDFRRIDPDLRPGWSRAYATVVEGGVVRPGDPAIVEP